MRWSALLLTACQTSMAPSTPPPSVDPSPAYEAWLGQVVTADGYVDWTSAAKDHDPLDRYVAWLARPGALPDDPAEAHAVWLNAYNAWTMYGVLQTGIPASVKDVPGWIPEPGSGFFVERTYVLGGSHYSLYVAEHSYIRAGIQDWRDHAALNCASMSCPPLRRELYAAARLDAQLDDQVRRWANDPVRGWRLDGDTVVFTPILDWFAADLPDTPGSPCSVLAPFATGDRAATLQNMAAAGCPHRFFEYDWRLNRPPRR